MPHFTDFGVSSLLKIVSYRGGKIPSWMCTDNKYVGKKVWYNKKLYFCVASSTNTITITDSTSEIKLNRREVLAPKGTIPQYKKKTIPELYNEIVKANPKVKSVKLVKSQGCQLHGDIDVILTLDDKVYHIPWNY